jgi:peptide/nickel transport system ATP-binding protein
MLPAIPGTVPNLSRLPQGCAFRERCFAAGRNAATPVTADGAEGPAGGLLVSATGETPCLMYCWNWMFT